METYKSFKPTQFDHHIEVEDRESWLVAPVSQTRDSECLYRSNFEVFLRELGGESDNVAVHRFGHWGPGWFEIILINPDEKDLVKKAEDMESALADYPILDESHFSELEHNEANKVWSSCYDIPERIEYIRDHRSQFDFNDFSDLMSCVRGEYFAGYDGELIS